ncbi:MAG: response regulator transcription factor [Pseudorhizobium sp.]
MTPTATVTAQDLFAVWSTTASRPDPRAVAIVAPPGTVSAPLCAAIERQFPWLHVHLVDALERLLAEEPEPVQLVLIDLSLVNRLQNYAAALRTHYPGLQVALLSQGEGNIDPAVLRRFDPRQMRGVLALDVKLDVFLSSLAIVLNGGTHYSGLNLDRFALQSRQHHVALTDEGDQGPPPPCSLSRLTSREHEILAHVARGRQNKNIAAVLGLSEHTVKIHIHNVITKLRVHNRTEAAAIYLRETATPGDRLPLTPRNIG